MGLFDDFVGFDSQKSALDRAYAQWEILQYQKSLNLKGLKRSGFDRDHSRDLHKTIDPLFGPDSKRALECLLHPNAAPKNEIPDEVLLLLEV